MASTASIADLALKPQATRFSLLHSPAFASPSSISFDNSRSRPPFFGQALRLVVSHPKISTICGARTFEGDPTTDVNAATVGGTAKPTTEENGCLVVNAPTANNVAAAEHGIALLTSMDRNVAQSDASMKAGKWQQNKYVGVSLVGKKLTVMGFGKVGSEVARRAKGLGMHVISHDPYAPADRPRAIGVELVSFDEAISTADFISLPMPLTPSTFKIFNDENFAKMKKGVRIIIVARGGVIDEDALLMALENGTVAQAALDVFAEEPPPKDSKLVLHENVTVTPHVGASTTEAQEGVAIEIAEAVIGALRGELDATAVNAPMVPSEVLSELAPYLLLAEKLGRLAINSKKVYIVYLGGYSHGKDATTDDFTIATNSHPQVLISFIKSNEKANEAMIYSYNKHINGFSAYLDEKEAMKISKHSDVLSVFESGFKQILPYHGNPI